jgi:glyoxylate/hydroxypyruvate reductase
VSLQRAGVPALLYPSKFRPNGAAELDDVTFAMVWKPPSDLLSKCPRLRGVQALGSGVDSIVHHMPPGVPLARIVRSQLV